MNPKRHRPSLKYNGLTIVLDKPSRFDNKELLSGYAGQLFSSALEVPRQACDIRLLSTLDEGYLPDTNTVLLLGENCVKVFKDTSLSEQRGCPWSSDNKTYIATFSPQDAVDRKEYFNPVANETEFVYPKDDSKGHGKTRRPNWRFWMLRDVSKASQFVKQPLNVVDGQRILWATSTTIIDILTNTKDQQLYFDIETNRQLDITCFGFSFGPDKAWCVPMVHGSHYYYEDTPKILRALAVAFRDNTVIIHNAMFDLFVMAWRYHIPPPLKIYDTMLAHHRVFPEIEKSLGHCISLYTNQPYHKNEGVFDPKNSSQFRQLYDYNAKDVLTTALIRPAIDRLAKFHKAEDSIKQVNASIRPYLMATLQGIRYKKDKVDSIIAENNRYCNQITRMLKLLVGVELNPNSPKQVSEYLYKGLRLKKPQRDLTNEKTLLQHRLLNNIPTITMILRYRTTAKESGQLKFPLYGMYNKTMEPRATTAYNLAGTTTFRLSSRRLLGKWGTNLQNMPKKLRKLFVPDPGKIFVQVDQAGAEALVVSYLCHPGQFRNLFLCGVKSHIFVALRLFPSVWESRLGPEVKKLCKESPDRLTNNPLWPKIAKLIQDSDNWPERYYFIAKMVCHAANYGMKAPTFRMGVLQKSNGSIALTNKQAKAFLDAYHRLFPEIHEWHNKTTESLRRFRTLRNLFGFPRIFTGPIDQSMFKEAYAFVPQSTVGTITNMAFTEMQHRVETDLKDFHVDVLQNNHDSILLQCPPRYVKSVAQEAQAHMNRKLISPRGESFQMKSEVMIGENWGDMKDV